VFRVIALPAPSDRQKTQMFIQRYVEHFPAAGEIVIFDRSWYNRAGVEKVMGFVSEKEAERFLAFVPKSKNTSLMRASFSLNSGWRWGRTNRKGASWHALTIRCASGSSVRWIWIRINIGTIIPERGT
jgi:Uncharacterized conserved protein